MLISTRNACGILVEAGSTHRHARQLLTCGLAGPVTRVRQWALYDEQRVLDLAGRTVLTEAEIQEHCPAGLLVARRAFDVRLSPQQLQDSLAVGWHEVSPWAWVEWMLHAKAIDGLPLVGTVAGFVVHAAEVCGWRIRGEGDSAAPGGLRLSPAGAWAEHVVGRRLVTGPGRAWEIREPAHGWQRARAPVGDRAPDHRRLPTA